MIEQDNVELSQVRSILLIIDFGWPKNLSHSRKSRNLAGILKMPAIFGFQNDCNKYLIVSQNYGVISFWIGKRSAIIINSIVGGHEELGIYKTVFGDCAFFFSFDLRTPSLSLGVFLTFYFY